VTVSILIPAFRPTYLRQALASALTQSAADLEILVSDDSGGDDVRAVVESFADPRIRYMTTPGRIGSGGNCRLLWDRCRTDRFLFLLDDDLLMPHALAELGDAMDAHPEAAFAYGRRYVVDEAGRITYEPPPGPPRALVRGDALADVLLRLLINQVGEVSNVLINRAVGLQADDLLTYEGLEVHVMADVGFYLNASRKGPVAGVGRPVAAFRQHGQQNSSLAFNPKLPMAAVEWELFLRGELDRGRVSQESALLALDKLEAGYRNWARRAPAVAQMAQGLTRLREGVAAGRGPFLDAKFRGDWRAVENAMLSRSDA
jgi:glycosyltransferase involved in cell wall biosynthesis